MFGLSLMNDKNRRKLLVPFTEMGRYYARTGYFDKAAVNRFAGPEYLPKAQIRMFRLIGQPVQRLFMGHMAGKMGCQTRLDAKPYGAFVRR